MTHTAIMCVTGGETFAPSINTISKINTVTCTQFVIWVCYFALSLLKDILKVTCCMKGCAITHVYHLSLRLYCIRPVVDDPAIGQILLQDPSSVPC